MTAGTWVWEYRDARGLLQRGNMERFIDYGGTDVTYFFRRRHTGELDVVSGSRLREARRVFETDNIQPQDCCHDWISRVGPHDEDMTQCRHCGARAEE